MLDLPPSFIPREYKPVAKRSIVVNTPVDPTVDAPKEYAVDETLVVPVEPARDEEDVVVEMDLLKMKTLKELRSMCTEKGLEHVGLKKHELVSLLNN